MVWPVALARLGGACRVELPLNRQAVRQFVHVQLLGYLNTVLTNLVDVTGGSVPILVHGYDHPIPDGKGFGIGPMNIRWLDPVNDPERYWPKQGAEIMLLLIDELNDMIINAAKPFAAHGARHLSLTGALAQQPGYSLSNYRTRWLNELHPTQLGYDVLAAVADTAIAAALAPATLGTGGAVLPTNARAEAACQAMSIASNASAAAAA